MLILEVSTKGTGHNSGDAALFHATDPAQFASHVGRQAKQNGSAVCGAVRGLLTDLLSGLNLLVRHVISP